MNNEFQLQTIYEEGELANPATCKECLQVQSEGSREATIRKYRIVRYEDKPAWRWLDRKLDLYLTLD